MIQTFAALLLAHGVADFLLQSRWMVDNKRRPGAMLAHGAVVFAASLAALGGGALAALTVTGAHLVIDAVKAHLGTRRLSHFLADQSAHALTLIATAAVWPGAFASGLWAAAGPLPEPVAAEVPAAMILAAGLILATRMGRFLVEQLMAPLLSDLDETEGLPNGGAVIGLLERALTFALVLAGQTAGVGFLIAAKSFLRVGTVERNRKLAEYVIIGTLASIGWALVVGYATVALMRLA